MSKTKNSYSQIMKATSLFGGVQVFNILISVIRSKAIALLVGPIGFGVIGLLNSTLRIIGDFTKVGLDTSAVKEISERNSDKDPSKVTEIIFVLEKLIWFTGTVGALITLVFSRYISYLTFGNTDYTYAFVWLSIAVLFTQLAKGKIAILQGTRRLKKLAYANLTASTVSLLITLPLYYFFKIDGIVPALIGTALITFGIFKFFTKEVDIPRLSFTKQELFHKSKAMLLLGATMSVTSMIVALTGFLIQIFIRSTDGLEAVGFYSAGFLIVNAYVGMIFTAMSTDYFPRLAAINTDNNKMNIAVNQQADVAILLITPVIVLFLTFAPFIVELLYSSKFNVIIGFVTFGVLGTFFKAVSFSLGYVIIAKGHSKVFITLSIIFNSLFLIISVVSYNIGGLTGVGIGFLVYYFIHFIALKVLTKYLYEISLTRSFYRTFLICAIICGSSFMATLVESPYLRYVLIFLLVVISIYYSVLQFDKKMDLKAIIKSIFKKDIKDSDL
jgi:O-antigen/teichoic acid export membrane protein